MHNVRQDDAPADGELEVTDKSMYALLQLQRLPVQTAHGINTPLVFWDPGSNVNMVTRRFTKMAGWQGTPTAQLLQSTNHQPEEWHMVAYHMLLVDLRGNEHKILVFEIEQIRVARELLYIMDSITRLFGRSCETVDISRPDGEVDILIGIHRADLHPVWWICRSIELVS